VGVGCFGGGWGERNWKGERWEMGEMEGAVGEGVVDGWERGGGGMKGGDGCWAWGGGGGRGWEGGCGDEGGGYGGVGERGGERGVVVWRWRWRWRGVVGEGDVSRCGLWGWWFLGVWGSKLDGWMGWMDVCRLGMSQTIAISPEILLICRMLDNSLLRSLYQLPKRPSITLQ